MLPSPESGGIVRGGGVRTSSGILGTASYYWNLYDIRFYMSAVL